MHHLTTQRKSPSNHQQIADWFQLLSESQRSQVAIERRNSERINFPFPVFLTPIQADGSLDVDESFGVIGRQISDRGFDFYYHHPIADKEIIASFEYSPDRWLGMKIKLNWCRFGRHGFFENGGEFLEVVDSPFGIAAFDS